MMYTYIVERTQIYLSRRESAALAKLARATGRTRSHLIREAIAAQYLEHPDEDEIKAALEATAGLWSDRSESGEAYVERLRSGRRLRDLHGDR